MSWCLSLSENASGLIIFSFLRLFESSSHTKIHRANKSFLQSCKLHVTVLMIYTGFRSLRALSHVVSEFWMMFKVFTELKDGALKSFLLSFCLCLCSWSAKLYLTPSNIVLLTAIALIGVCVFILVIIGILHWQEKVRTNISALCFCSLFWAPLYITHFYIPCFFCGSVWNTPACLSFCSKGFVTSHRLIRWSTHVCEDLSRWVCLCVALPSGSLWGCSAHTAMLLIALFCPFSISNLFLIIPRNMSSRVLCVSFCTWMRAFVFLSTVGTSECVNLFLLNTQDGSQQSANQLVVQQLICEVDEFT